MSHAKVNGVELGYEESGTGETTVLVHGSWSDRHVWDALWRSLAEHGRVVRYDRRGHGLSGRPAHDSTRADHEDDLAALIEAVGGGPARVVGTSFGGSIALGLAARRPDLVSVLAVHEPPLLSWAPDRPVAIRDLGLIADAVARVTALLEAGDPVGAATRFAEDVALGPGSWKEMPEEARAMMVAAAPTFAVEQRDPRWAALDAASAEAIECPVLFTVGSESPAWFRGISERLAEAIESAELETVRGAGHTPHVTHPADYRDLLAAFFARTTPAFGLA